MVHYKVIAVKTLIDVNVDVAGNVFACPTDVLSSVSYKLQMNSV